MFPLLLFPCFRLLVWNSEKRKRLARLSVHHTFRFFVWMMESLGIYDLQVSNLPDEQSARGKVLIANHPTLIDVVILISLFKNADCIVKNSLWRNPFIGGVVRGTGYISNGDPDGLIQDCGESLSKGNVLIIFPEGTRTKPGSRELNKFQRGAANIASRCNANFLPATLDVKPDFLHKNVQWYQVPETKVDIKVDFFKEISVAEFAQMDNQNIAARQLTKQIETYYRGLMSEYE